MLYHRELGFPKIMRIPSQYEFILDYTQHALNAAKSDRYGDITLPKHLVVKKEEIIEIESINGINPDKIVARVDYNTKYDLCLVIMVKDGRVKTVWLNDKGDLHRTLDKSKYET